MRLIFNKRLKSAKTAASVQSLRCFGKSTTSGSEMRTRTDLIGSTRTDYLKRQIKRAKKKEDDGIDKQKILN